MLARGEQLAEYIVAAYEDRRGHLWFGTMARGAIRYDGQTLTYLTMDDGLPSNTVHGFAEDTDGNLWMGTHGGIAKYDGTIVTTVDLGGGRAGFPEGSGWVSSDRDGTVWVGINRKLYRYTDGEFIRFELPITNPNPDSYSILAGSASMDLKDSTGNLWFGTDGHGAYRFDGTTWTHFTKADGLCSNTVNDIVEDKHGHIWFACMQSFNPEPTGDGGVCRFDGESFTTFPQHQGLHNNDIYTLYRDRDGHIWIGATGHAIYHHHGEQFTKYEGTDRPDLSRNFGVQAALHDSQGRRWFGFSGGLFRLMDGKIVNVTTNGPWDPDDSC